MRTLAIVLLVGGLAALAYGFVMDTSVSMREKAAEGGVPGGLEQMIPENMRATDPALVDRRQTMLLGGGLVALVGAVLFGFSMRRPQPA